MWNIFSFVRKFGATCCSNHVRVPYSGLAYGLFLESCLLRVPSTQDAVLLFPRPENKSGFYAGKKVSSGN